MPRFVGTLRVRRIGWRCWGRKARSIIPVSMNCDEWRQEVNKDRKEKVNLTTPIKLELADPPRFVSAPAQIEGDLRSEEHTSELQSPCNLVCRLLLEKKKNTIYQYTLL